MQEFDSFLKFESFPKISQMFAIIFIKTPDIHNYIFPTFANY